MRNIIDPLIERIHNFQFSDTFEIDEDESFQKEEQEMDDDVLISYFDIKVDYDTILSKEA